MRVCVWMYVCMCAESVGCVCACIKVYDECVGEGHVCEGVCIGIQVYERERRVGVCKTV